MYLFDEMSNAEKEVFIFLEKLSFYKIYEQPVYISDDKKRPRIFVPDFFLPEIGVYLEVIKDPKLNNYPRRMKIYKMNKVTILQVHTSKSDWQTKLIDDLNSIAKNRAKKMEKISKNFLSINEENKNK